ncbi:hypothetical protein A3Q56_05900, partial [Intoshia linei]
DRVPNNTRYSILDDIIDQTPVLNQDVVEAIDVLSTDQSEMPNCQLKRINF